MDLGCSIITDKKMALYISNISVVFFFDISLRTEFDTENVFAIFHRIFNMIYLFNILINRERKYE